MRSWALAAAALAALVIGKTNADGVCYDPDHVSSKSPATIAADMELIKSKGFSHVRTYIAEYGGQDMVSTIAKSGLRVTVGIPYPYSGYANHIDVAVKAAKATGNIEAILIGNENLANKGSVPQEMIDVINSVKARVGSGVKVGTAQRTTELAATIPSGMDRLISACDVIGANVHPFFTPGTIGENAIVQTNSQWNAMLNKLPQLKGKLMVSETGWPTSGQYSRNFGSKEGAEAYVKAYKAWSGMLPEGMKYLFQMFDQPQRPESYEKAFGIMYADSKPKFDISGNGFAPTSAPATTAPPKTPAPTTAAPKTETPKPTTAAPKTTAPVTTAPAATTTKPSPIDQAKPTTAPTTTKVDASKAGSASAGSSSAGSGSVGHGSLHGAGSEAAGSASNVTINHKKHAGSQSVDQTVGAAVDEQDTLLAATPTPLTPEAPASADGSNQETKTQSKATSANNGAVIFVVLGCVMVACAAAFVYKTRQRALEMDRESKELELIMTPMGECML